MIKNSANRFLHAFIPFSITVFMQRILLLLLGKTGIDGNIVELLAFAPAAVCGAILFLLAKPRMDEEENSADAIPSLRPRDPAVSFMFCAAAVAAMVCAMYAVAFFMGGTETDGVRLSGFSVISLVIVHPIIEEYLFRGLFYKELRLMNPIFAILVQAVMFAIVHNAVNEMMYALVSGMILALLVELSGRLVTAVAAHMVINARSLIYLTVLADMPNIIRAVDTVLIVLGVLSLFGVLAALGRGQGQEVGVESEVEHGGQ